MSDLFGDRRQLMMTIVAANKGEEPFINKERFNEALDGAYDIINSGKSPDRDSIVKLMASHHWDSFEQRRVFKRIVFHVLYGGLNQVNEDSAAINDMPIHITETRPGDILGAMLAKQRQNMIEYQPKYLANDESIAPEALWGNLDFRCTQNAIREANLYLIEELMEAQNLLKAKPWKESFKATDPDAYWEEIADAIHFFLELLIYSGLDTPDKIYDAYMAKTRTNEIRRATGY